MFKDVCFQDIIHRFVCPSTYPHYQSGWHNYTMDGPPNWQWIKAIWFVFVFLLAGKPAASGTGRRVPGSCNIPKRQASFSGIQNITDCVTMCYSKYIGVTYSGEMWKLEKTNCNGNAALSDILLNCDEEEWIHKCHFYRSSTFWHGCLVLCVHALSSAQRYHVTDMIQ